MPIGACHTLNFVGSFCNLLRIDMSMEISTHFTFNSWIKPVWILIKSFCRQLEWTSMKDYQFQRILLLQLKNCVKNANLENNPSRRLFKTHIVLFFSIQLVRYHGNVNNFSKCATTGIPSWRRLLRVNFNHVNANIIDVFRGGRVKHSSVCREGIEKQYSCCENGCSFFSSVRCTFFWSWKRQDYFSRFAHCILSVRLYNFW